MMGSMSGSYEYPQSMFLSRNKKHNVYSCKPQFYNIKVGLRESKLYRYVFVMTRAIALERTRYTGWNLSRFYKGYNFYGLVFVCLHISFLLKWNYSKWNEQSRRKRGQAPH